MNGCVPHANPGDSQTGSDTGIAGIDADGDATGDYSLSLASR